MLTACFSYCLGALTNDCQCMRRPCCSGGFALLLIRGQEAAAELESALGFPVLWSPKLDSSSVLLSWSLVGRKLLLWEIYSVLSNSFVLSFLFYSPPKGEVKAGCSGSACGLVPRAVVLLFRLMCCLGLSSCEGMELHRCLGRYRV